MQQIFVSFHIALYIKHLYNFAIFSHLCNTSLKNKISDLRGRNRTNDNAAHSSVIHQLFIKSKVLSVSLLFNSSMVRSM